MTQFKTKSGDHKQKVECGLCAYPVLMAADLFANRATHVPVDHNQAQHVEPAHEFSRKSNARIGDVFPEPQPILSITPCIIGLDSRTKMSKCRDNAIGFFSGARTIEKKLKTASTDEHYLRCRAPERPEICTTYIHIRKSPPLTNASLSQLGTEMEHLGAATANSVCATICSPSLHLCNNAPPNSVKNASGF
jgi:tryptophanyl-tRNA synthetase